MIQAAETIADIKKIPFWSQFTDEQIRVSIHRSKNGIERMKARAIETGKKQGGFTLAELQEMIDRYERILAS